MSKLSRERRTLDRQRKQHMSREEVARSLEFQKIKEVCSVEFRGVNPSSEQKKFFLGRRD